MSHRFSGTDRLRLLARRIVGFLATQRVAQVADRARRLHSQSALLGLGHDRATKLRTAYRSRP
jgi:hypothetical protein